MADEDPRSDSEIPVGVEHVAGIDFRPEAYDALLATKVDAVSAALAPLLEPGPDARPPGAAEAAADDGV